MIAKTLVFACAVFGLAAGSCFDFQIPQQNAQVISVPTTSEISCGTPELSQFFSAPVSAPVAAPAQTFSLSSGSSDALAEILAAASSGASGSSQLQATNGPSSAALSVIEGSPVTLPAVEAPIITLSSQPIPAPRVLSQRCICTKTILKPQVYQRTVTVPKIQRYLKRTVTPVVENLAYKSSPIPQPESAAASSVVIPGSSQLFSDYSSNVFSGLVSGSQSFPVVASSCPKVC